jgi:hypothetical protein
MKRLDRQLIGILLVLGVVCFAAAYQWLGPGLVVTEHPPTPPEAAAQGIKVMERTTYHFALIPLGILGVLGLILGMSPKRDETRVS